MALQLSTRGAYLGYQTIMQMGLRWDRESFDRKGLENEVTTGSVLFVSFLAGMD